MIKMIFKLLEQLAWQNDATNMLRACKTCNLQIIRYHIDKQGAMDAELLQKCLDFAIAQALIPVFDLLCETYSVDSVQIVAAINRAHYKPKHAKRASALWQHLVLNMGHDIADFTGFHELHVGYLESTAMIHDLIKSGVYKNGAAIKLGLIETGKYTSLELLYEYYPHTRSFCDLIAYSQARVSASVMQQIVATYCAISHHDIATCMQSVHPQYYALIYSCRPAGDIQYLQYIQTHGVRQEYYDFLMQQWPKCAAFADIIMMHDKCLAYKYLSDFIATQQIVVDMFWQYHQTPDFNHANDPLLRQIICIDRADLFFVPGFFVTSQNLVFSCCRETCEMNAAKKLEYYIEYRGYYFYSMFDMLNCSETYISKKYLADNDSINLAVCKIDAFKNNIC